VPFVLAELIFNLTLMSADLATGKVGAYASESVKSYSAVDHQIRHQTLICFITAASDPDSRCLF
jgi:hypothetical protein